jgi:lipopolysaccharide/colanic/teichoic acid biosynthesis glycosyltransferase
MHHHEHHHEPHQHARVLAPACFRVRPARRVLDVVVAGCLLVLCLPVLAVAAALVWATDRGPVVFRQPRLGENGRPFTLLKLRSMRVGGGPAVTTSEDARVTRVGRVLRRTSVDELPQLWHVVRGQMTLVGPRPESVSLAARYPASCQVVLQARPGLTGPAQLRFRERTAVPPPGWDVEQWYLERLVPLRVAADLDYLAEPTLSQTLRYVGLTALHLLGVHDQDVPVAAPGVETRPESPSVRPRSA